MSRRRALAGAIGAALLLAAAAVVAIAANLALLGFAPDRGDPVGRLSPRVDVERRGPEAPVRTVPGRSAPAPSPAPDGEPADGPARSGAGVRDD